MEIQNYICNDFYDVYNGKLKSSIDAENRQINFTGIDIINSQSVCETWDRNLVLNPKQTSNKTEIKNFKLNFFKRFLNEKRKIENSFLSELAKNNNFPEKNSTSLFNFYFYFHREKSLDCSYTVNGKIYCIFPNINLELKRINKIPISRSVLSKFLVNGGRLDKLENEEAEQLKNLERKNGFLAMSSKHRLITLQNTPESRKEILFGIWLNLSEEKVTKSSINEGMLNKILKRYSEDIYDKCLNFLMMSKKIDVINSPSPDEGIFLLCLFLNGAQYFYEVKVLPNEKEKVFQDPENKSCLSNYSNEWLIVKKNFEFENISNMQNFPSKISFFPQKKSNYENLLIKFNLSEGQSQNKIYSANGYFKKKYILNRKDSLRNSNNTNLQNITSNKARNLYSIGVKCEKGKSTNTNFKDPLNEIFEDEFDKETVTLKYDFPLSIPKKQSKLSIDAKNPNLISYNQQYENLKKAIAPKSNNKIIKTNSSISGRNNQEDSEARLRENLLVRKSSNSQFQQNLTNKNENTNIFISNNSHNQSNFAEESHTQGISQTSKGFTENSGENIHKLPSSFHREASESSNLNMIENKNNIYLNVRNISCN